VAPEQTKLRRLEEQLLGIGRCVVAFSGGVDSTFLAAVATRVLGAENTLCVTAVSPSLASAELEHCSALAVELGLNWKCVDTDEMERAAYRRNDRDRCFHCKSALMDAVVPLADDFAGVVLLGVNVNDLGDERPGQAAAQERGAKFPMVAAELTKDDIREYSRELGVSTWDKPAMACLASRIPNGTPVTVQVLSKVERAEALLREVGTAGNIRVRHFDGIACIEVDPDQFEHVEKNRLAIIEGLRILGYERVVLDLAGFRSGSLSKAETSGSHGGLSGRAFHDLVS